MPAAAAIDERVACGERYFGARAGELARLCHAMAERFARGGRLLAVGATPAAWSDARHVAVEFVHPVIVGKRALPALALRPEALALLAARRRHGDGLRRRAGGARPRRRGAAPRLPDDRASRRARARRGSSRCRRTTRSSPRSRRRRPTTCCGSSSTSSSSTAACSRAGRSAPHHDAGASAFLYPFLAEAEHDLDAVLADVRGSVLAKAAEAGALRSQTLTDNAEALAAAARALRACLDAGGKVLALGNGGSATDAMDAVADLAPPAAAVAGAARRSTSPTTRRCSPRWRTTSAPRRSSRGR